MTDKLILNHFIDLGGIATRNNFYSQNAKTHKGSMLQTNRLFKRWVNAGLIQKLEPVIPVRDNWREVFYCITKKGASYIDRGDEWKRGISKNRSPHNVFHESMVRDVALGFLRNYPDYFISINYDEVFKNKEVIKPDLTVRMEKDGKSYVFLIEIERKKTIDRVRKEKLDKYEKVFTGLDLKKFRLPEKFKILFIYANLEYNSFIRPQEYVEHKVKIDKTKQQLNNLVKQSTDLSDNRYRFLSFTDFYRLNEPIWLTPKGNIVSLIN